MPSRAPRVCGLCGGVHQPGERCPVSLARERERKARHDAKRPTARARGYDNEWRRDRAAFLTEHPTCTRCGKPASVVDHIRPHKGNKALFCDRRNWQPLCKPCHDRHKQRAERANERTS